MSTIASASVEHLADWSGWQPFGVAVATAPLSCGVYLVRERSTGQIVYVGMAGDRNGKGLRGRLRAYASGKAIASGLGEAVMDRSLADADWLEAQLAEVRDGRPRRATAWGVESIVRADLEVRWASTSDTAVATQLETECVRSLGATLWNRRLQAQSARSGKTARRASTPAAPLVPGLMRTWLIRAGERGSMLEACIEADVIAMRYRTVGDARLHDVDELARQFALAKTRKDVLGGVRRLKQFAHDVAEGDLVVSPRSSDRSVHIARVIGPYDFVDPSPVPDFRHLHPVRWIQSFNRDDLPTARRKDIDRPPALYELLDGEWWEAALATCRV